MNPPVATGQSLDVRRAVAVSAGKASALLSRLLGRGGGTAMPGLVATRLDPDIVSSLAGQLRHGAVVITGTNGKTTTARALGVLVSAGGYTPVRNEEGSNLLRGIASSLVSKSNALGRLTPAGPTVGLFEVDEAAFPEIVQQVRPGMVLLLDLFRDQLDRYGEVATVARLWSQSLGGAAAGTTVVANADDPLVAHVAGARGPAVYFGIESVAGQQPSASYASDVKTCPRCGGRIEYSRSTLGHLGEYWCVACTFRRPAPVVWAAAVTIHGMSGTSFTLGTSQGSREVSLRLPGLYNVYNALAAASAALTLGIPLTTVATALTEVTPAFGRMEQIAVEGRDVYLALAKNPTGLNEVLRTIVTASGRGYLLVMLNDNTADGRDVSWIWDADVEMLDSVLDAVVFGGTRAEDMALRFKYAGLLQGERVRWAVERDTHTAFKKAVAWTPAGNRLCVVPTYTALLDIRSTLTRLGYARPYWEERI